MLIKEIKLKSFVATILKKGGSHSEEAQIVADHLVRSNLAVARSTNEEKSMQIRDLDQFHQFHASEQDGIMERLSETAIKNGNIFEALMETVQVCSLGQITQKLYQLGGKYRRNM